MIQTIKNELIQSIELKRAILSDQLFLKKLEELSSSCVYSLKLGGKIILAGNGGSFADAQHISGELLSRFMFDKDPLASIVLGANSSAISAIANDYGYEKVFARELECLALENDIFIPISTSGNSQNIIAAVRKAHELGIKVLAFTGANGGVLAQTCDCLKVPSTQTPRIQEAHITIGHILCGLVEKEYFHGRS